MGRSGSEPVRTKPWFGPRFETRHEPDQKFSSQFTLSKSCSDQSKLEHMQIQTHPFVCVQMYQSQRVELFINLWYCWLCNFSRLAVLLPLFAGWPHCSIISSLAYAHTMVFVPVCFICSICMPPFIPLFPGYSSWLISACSGWIARYNQNLIYCCCADSFFSFLTKHFPSWLLTIFQVNMTVLIYCLLWHSIDPFFLPGSMTGRHDPTVPLLSHYSQVLLYFLVSVHFVNSSSA